VWWWYPSNEKKTFLLSPALLGTLMNLSPPLPSPATVYRHVVLPPDIAKLLPKGRLLSEVRSPRLGYIVSRGAGDIRLPGSQQRRPALLFSAPSNLFLKRFLPQARASTLTPPLMLTSPVSAPLCEQAEWRGLGVQQSRGWVHYAIHRPEPHIMLYR
jgi:hypothetical protein